MKEADIILSEYNDSDPFTPGDACGYRDENNNPDYFYGLAPGFHTKLYKLSKRFSNYKFWWY